MSRMELGNAEDVQKGKKKNCKHVPKAALSRVKRKSEINNKHLQNLGGDHSNYMADRGPELNLSSKSY